MRSLLLPTTPAIFPTTQKHFDWAVHVVCIPTLVEIAISLGTVKLVFRKLHPISDISTNYFSRLGLTVVCVFNSSEYVQYFVRTTLYVHNAAKFYCFIWLVLN